MEHLELFVPASILGIMPASSLVPGSWRLEACGCVLSFLPMLPELVAKDVERHLRDRQAGKDSNLIDSLEDL